MTRPTSLDPLPGTLLAPELQQISEARHHDPFRVLGPQRQGERLLVRSYLPGARAASIEAGSGWEAMQRLQGTDFFQWRGMRGAIAEHYRLRVDYEDGRTWCGHDPYCFAPLISDFDLHLFGEGVHRHAYRFLGARVVSVDGVTGVLFGVWAPGVERVSVVGDFNRWDGRRHPMRCRGGSGVWELFVPQLAPGELYKFELRDRHGTLHIKTDPYGRRFELRPATAAVVEGGDTYAWGDARWLETRRGDCHRAPLAIYELHAGSWQRDADGGFLDYRTLAHRLVPYLQETGFTHVELLPITEHPFDGSWGYQATGYFAPTSRFGTPEDFRYFVDHCHRHGIGVLLDWVPAHFPKDGHALARFNGNALYEHADPRRGEHRDWGTYIFDFGRNEVKAFLISSALFWLEEFHLDGLRVDAVAAMLYLDYSRAPGEWLPNIHGGRENLEAIAFLRELNQAIQAHAPGTLTVAEESTAWPGVSRPVEQGGLGFSMKWNMGWMNDTLTYMHRDPVHRRWHHGELTFGLMYAFSENFLLPFSHDEVVHLKRPMLGKMPGDTWQRFASLRLLYTYLYAMPGKKLLFMGNEFGQTREWDFDTALEWERLDEDPHAGVKRLVGDLNRLYREAPALHGHDFDPAGFQWLDCDDADHSRLAFLRLDGAQALVVALNFTPQPHPHYVIGVPTPGRYEVAFNSDSRYYGGSNMGNPAPLGTRSRPAMGYPNSLEVVLPPLAGIVLRRVPH